MDIRKKWYARVAPRRHHDGWRHGRACSDRVYSSMVKIQAGSL